MVNWTPTILKPFTPQGFDAYCATVKLHFTPQFIVLHNTAAPTWAQWPVDDIPAQFQRMKNLEHYYRDVQKWSAGPHVFISDHLWVFTPLEFPGVHSPSWNRISWGVELVGNYEVEQVPPVVSSNAVACLRSLHKLGKLTGNWLRLHREDPRTTHRGCPGRNVDRNGLLAAI